MCFSAPASFVASGALSIIGVSSLTVASKEEKVLALFPIIFGIQQGFEAVQWLALENGTPSLVAGYGFLFFAYAFWPIYVPIAVFLFDKKRRKFLLWTIVFGGMVSLFFLGLLLLNPLSVSTAGHSIVYDLRDPLNSYSVIAYLVAVFLPLFASSNRFLRWFGSMNIALALLAGVFYTETFASVWCFFAAVSSIIFLVYLKHRATIKSYVEKKILKRK